MISTERSREDRRGEGAGEGMCSPADVEHEMLREYSDRVAELERNYKQRAARLELSSSPRSSPRAHHDEEGLPVSAAAFAITLGRMRMDLRGRERDARIAHADRDAMAEAREELRLFDTTSCSRVEAPPSSPSSSSLAGDATDDADEVAGAQWTGESGSTVEMLAQLDGWIMERAREVSGQQLDYQKREMEQAETQLEVVTAAPAVAAAIEGWTERKRIADGEGGARAQRAKTRPSSAATRPGLARAQSEGRADELETRLRRCERELRDARHALRAAEAAGEDEAAAAAGGSEDCIVDSLRAMLEAKEEAEAALRGRAATLREDLRKAEAAAARAERQRDDERAQRAEAEARAAALERRAADAARGGTGRGRASVVAVPQQDAGGLRAALAWERSQRLAAEHAADNTAAENDTLRHQLAAAARERDAAEIYEWLSARCGGGPLALGAVAHGLRKLGSAGTEDAAVFAAASSAAVGLGPGAGATTPVDAGAMRRLLAHLEQPLAALLYAEWKAAGEEGGGPPVLDSLVDYADPEWRLPRLAALFEAVDRDGDGRASVGDLEAACLAAGTPVSVTALEALARWASATGDASVTLLEFRRMMRGLPLSYLDERGDVVRKGLRVGAAPTQPLSDGAIPREFGEQLRALAARVSPTPPAVAEKECAAAAAAASATTAAAAKPKTPKHKDDNADESNAQVIDTAAMAESIRRARAEAAAARRAPSAAADNAPKHAMPVRPAVRAKKPTDGSKAFNEGRRHVAVADAGVQTSGIALPEPESPADNEFSFVREVRSELAHALLADGAPTPKPPPARPSSARRPSALEVVAAGQDPPLPGSVPAAAPRPHVRAHSARRPRTPHPPGGGRSTPRGSVVDVTSRATRARHSLFLALTDGAEAGGDTGLTEPADEQYNFQM